ncbi:contractile injection system protein, VgrG/Pvc8 family [Sorangium cellulosum]|uniref:contractile injection system protein, VgrG/Pvc8 family n=1 Tax=Sorangium cellulosum TaxID=56 RepID=UPI0009D72E5C|nr:contractile injection system protein, VgrG/Pvc8 family [Sorangium cellulosum]
MSNGAPQPSTFELRAGSLAARDLTVLAFRGREAVSRGYRVDIDVAVPPADPAVFESQVLEQPMRLALQGEAAPLRVVHGVCTHAAWSAALEDGRSVYRLRLASRLSLLGKRRTSRIFQDRTVDAIVNLVLEEWRIPHRFARVRTSPKRAYCVQYRETDRDFVPGKREANGARGAEACEDASKAKQRSLGLGAAESAGARHHNEGDRHRSQEAA